MPDKKYLIEIPDMPEGSGIWDADKWERNKDAFMADYPNANIFEIGQYDAEDSRETDQIMLSFDDDEASSGVWDQAKWERNKDAFMTDYPEAHIDRVRYVDYWSDKASGDRARMEELQQPDEARNARLADMGYYDDITGGQVQFGLDAPSVIGLKPLSSAIEENSVSGEVSYRDPKVEEFFANDSAHTERQMELNRLREEYDNNPRVIEQREYEAQLARYAEDLEKQIKSDMESEVDVVKASRGASAKHQFGGDMTSDQMGYLLDKIAGDEAGSGAAENEKQERYMSALKLLQQAKDAREVAGKGLGGGIADTAKDWVRNAATQSDIEMYNEVGDILTRLEQKAGNLNDVTDEDIENNLSNDEKALIRAFFEYNAAMADAGEDMSTWYKGGKIFAESIPFMLEFLVTGGFANSAGRAATSWMGKGFAKWIAKSAKGTGARLAKKAVAKTVSGVAKTLVASAARTLVAPTTYKNMAEQSVSYGEDGHLDRGANMVNAAVDSYIEQLSEMSGAAFGKVLGGAGRLALGKTAFDKIGAWFGNNVTMQALSRLGFHGLPEEVGEEIFGNALRTITGVDKEALGRMFEKDEFASMIIGFAPMTLIGAGTSAAQMGAVSIGAANAGRRMRQDLSRSYTEEQIDQVVMSLDAAKDANQIAEAIKPIITGMAAAGAPKHEIQSVWDYAIAVAKKKAMISASSTQEMQLSEAKIGEAQEQMGGRFWIENEDGTRDVKQIVLNNGATAYVVSKPDQDGRVAIINATTGQKGTALPKDIKEESWNGTLNAFGAGLVMADRTQREQQRMQDERATQINEVQKRLSTDPRINVGTEGSPVYLVAQSFNEAGVRYVAQDGSVGNLSWEQVADSIGMPIVVKTDAQIAQEEAEALVAAAAERRAKRAKMDEVGETERTNAVVDAENAVAEGEQITRHIPMNEDGTVNEAAFWEQDPEGYVKWNDEQNQDGGQDSLQQVAIAKQELMGLLQEANAAQNTSNPTTRKAAKKEVERLADRIARLDAIEQSYMQSLEEEKAAVQQTAATPTSSMSEEDLESMDAQYQGILGKTRVQGERVRVMQEYLDKLAEGSVPVVLLTRQNYEEKMKADGLHNAIIRRVKAQVDAGRSVAGFMANGKVYLMDEGLNSIDAARITYIHERQHTFNRTNNEVLAEVANLLESKEKAIEILKTFVGEKGIGAYESLSIEGLADEIVAYSMEKAYTTEDFSVDLQSRGIPSEVISIITEIDNEQRKDQSLSQARRRRGVHSHAAVSGAGSVREDGRNLEQISGGVLEQQAARPSGSSGGGAQIGESAEEVNPAFVEAISTDVDEAEYAQFLDDKAFQNPQPAEGFDSDDVRFSIVKEGEMRGNTQAYFDKHYKGGKLGKKDQKLVPLNITHFTQELLDAANAQIEEMRKYMLPFLDMESKGKRFLPAEVYGKSTLFDNSSYGKTMENTLICTRTLAYIDFVEEVKKRIGRPLTATESFLASQMLYDIAIDPQCLYCYVSLDRKAYDEFLLRYTQQRDEVISKWNASDKSAEAKEQLYKEFLDGRKPTSQMQARFESWLLLAEGDNAITTADLATKARRGELKIAEVPEAWEKARDKYKKLKGEKKLAYAASEEYQTALWNYLASPLGQVTDAEAYAQSASWAKKEEDYRSYTGELLNCTADALKGLMGHYGLRFYSFSEYSPAFILENMQMVRDAAARGLKGFAYTKEADFIRIFAPTGMNINCSVYGRVDSEGNVVPDTKQGADWAQVQALREQYPNVGAVFVATNDEMVEWALNQPWIDVIIPFHIVRTGADIAKFYEWTNYTSMSADTTPSGKSTYVYPHEHHNDKETFLQIAQERGLTPRFADVKLSDGRSIVEHENYMRLVNETRRSVDETPILTPIFNVDAAKESFDAFVEKGGYYSGYFYEDEAFEQGIETVVEDIKAGKTAKDVEYGRQDVPIDVAKIMAKRAEQERKHGKGPVDILEEAKNAAINDVMFRFVGEQAAARLDNAVNATMFMDNLQTAREMEDAGADARVIKRSTGWERGADGKWRHEMPDFEIKAKPGKKKTFKLQDLITDSTLFIEYPQMKDVKVRYKKMASGLMGQLTEENGKPLVEMNDIQFQALNPRYVEAIEAFSQKYPELAEKIGKGGGRGITAEEKKTFIEEVGEILLMQGPYLDLIGGRNTLAHELQHLIQQIEGFAEGGNSDMVDTTDPAIAKENEELNNLIRAEMLAADSMVPELNDLVNQIRAKRAQGIINKRLEDEYNQKRAEWLAHKDNYNRLRKERAKLRRIGNEGYNRLAGEVEARNVEERIKLTDEQRRESLYSDTQDVATEDQIFLRGNLMTTAPLQKSEVSFRITPEMDKAYMDAVKAGDMETAQRMVIEAAKIAMPNTKVVDENGNPKVVYHGTGSEFYTFRDTSDSNELGAGYYFSDSYEMAERYATDETLADNRFRAEALAFEIFTDEMGHSEEDYDDNEFIDDYNKSYDLAVERLFGNGHVKSVFLNLENPRILSRVSPDFDPTYRHGFNHYNEGVMAKRFNDGVIDEMFTERHEGLTGNQYVAFSPSQIKSADPVTYDDTGNVIPLSERFNPENEDIRFRMSNENQAIFVSNAARAVEGIKQEKATPEQWLKMIEKAGGLKAGEDKWMGLSDWLKASDKKTLTKAEVLDFINKNMIVIEETRYTADAEDDAASRHDLLEQMVNERYKEILKSLQDIEDYDERRYKAFNLFQEELGEFADLVELDWSGAYLAFPYEDLGDYAEFANVFGVDVNLENPIHDTRLAYTTNGLDNLHEIALTVPTIESWGAHDTLHFGDAGNGRAIAWIRFGETEVPTPEYKVLLDEMDRLKAVAVDLYEEFGGRSNELAEVEERQEELREEMRSFENPGLKVLVIDEIQSKRHQEGREKGYDNEFVYRNSTIGEYSKYDEDQDVADIISAEGRVIGKMFRSSEGFAAENTDGTQMTSLRNSETDALSAMDKAFNNYGIPDAPFDKNWHELAMKRMLRYAAENGYDVIAWTKGDQQAERYDLSRAVKKISASKPTKDGERIVNIYYRDEYNDYKNLVVDKDGKVVQGDYTGNALADVVGKEMALQIMNAEDATEFKGEGLKIGGEGMRGFYDKMLPSFMNKYGKKWGVKVEDIDLPNLGKFGYTMHSVPVTEEMKASVMEGQVMFRTTEITPEVRDEMDVISATALINGNYMQAPNGKPTNLTAEQWAMVRTKNFLRWFGDWENDPENASKVVDENGEPKVVYHGSTAMFTVFDKSRIGSATGTADGRGFYFTTDRDYALGYKTPDGQLFEVFLNIKKPLSYDKKTITKAQLRKILKEADRVEYEQEGEHYMLSNYANYNDVGIDGAVNEGANLEYDYADNDVELIGSLIGGSGSFDLIMNAVKKVTGKSGMIAPKDNGTIHYVVTDPTGIKSATDNTGEFSEEEGDIRFRTSLELDEEFGDAWRNQQNEDGRHSTQVANTKSTYEKIGRYLEDAGMKGASILDASSGLGLGTQALREMGFKVDDVEPFPSENREAPTFSSYADIDGKYDVVISNAVLNVIPDDWRADVLHQMADAVKDGGKMIINTRPASNIAQQGVEGKTRITLDSPSEILVKRGDRIAAYQKGFTSEELAAWITSELGEGWRVEKATKKNSGISGEGTAVVIKESDDTRFRVTGTPTDEVVASGLDMTPAQTAELAGNIFAALPEDSRKKITDGLSSVFDLKDAILQIPTSLAMKENWDDEDKELASIVRDKVQDIVDASRATSRPLTTKEALWMLHSMNESPYDFLAAAKDAIIARNLGFDPEGIRLRRKTDDYIRFRTAGSNAIDAATDMYDFETSLWTERLKESWLDMNQSVISLQNAMAQASGMEIEPWENIEFALNRLSSKSYADKKKYLRDFLMPMWDAIMEIVKVNGKSIEEIERYMMLKHGLERNKKMAQRDAREFYRAMYDLVAERMKNQSHAEQVVALSEAKKRLADIDAQIAVAPSSQLPRLNEARAKAQYDVAVADLVLRGDETQNEAELQAYYDAIDNELDPKYREFREKDYGGLTSMFVDTTDVKRSDYKSEEAYQRAVLAATTPKFDKVADMEAEAEKEVDAFERLLAPGFRFNLWNKVNAATKETLRHQYESGMISLEQYEAVRDMFEYYVPLRGFADNTAEDMYSYYMNNSAGGFAKPILGAKGRKTRAESPLGWIGTMAESAIQADNKNEAKMCLYYMTLRRPDQNLLTITETWYEYTGQKDSNGKKIFKAAYPPAVDHTLTADELRQHMEDWEDDMKKKQSRGEAYKGSQRVDLKGSVIFQDEKEEKEHIVRVKVAGKDYSILINGNPRAAQAINGLLNPDANVGPVAQWIGDARRNLSALLTSYSPLFWVANYQRDLLSSVMRVSEADGWDTAMKYLANRRKAWRVASYIYKYDAGSLGDSYYEKLYKEFAENGGITGYTALTTNKEYEELLKKYAENVDKKVLNAMKGAWDKFMGFGEAIEQVSRFAAFITAREEGKSIEEAINAAKEVSVNFNRKGSAKPISLDELDKLRTKDGKKLNQAQRVAVLALSAMPGPMKFCYYFVNASIQALSSSAKLAKKSPGKATAWVGMYMGASIALAMLNYLLSDDDDDEYLNLPDYLRHSTALIKVADGYYFKWSIPQEMRPFYAWADILVRKMMGNMPHKSGAEVGKEMALAASQWLPVNPFEAEDPLLSLVPDFASPVAEIKANTNAFGGKIYDDMAFKSEGVVKEIPAYRKATEKTGAVYVDMAEFLNDVSGGDEVTKGLININPAIIEHLVEGYGGGIYDFAKMMVSIPSMILSDDPVQVKEIPFVNKVILSVDETNMYSHTNDAFYYYKNIADNAKRVEKEYRESEDPSRADEYRKEEDWRVYLLYKEYEADFKSVKERLDNAVDKDEEDLLKQEQNVLREMFLDDIAKGELPEITYEIREDIKRMEKDLKKITQPVTDANKERLERKKAGDVDGMLEAIEKRDSLKETPEYQRAERIKEEIKVIKKQLSELGTVGRSVQRDSVLGELQRNYDQLKALMSEELQDMP